jgi:hypothetical protein
MRSWRATLPGSRPRRSRPRGSSGWRTGSRRHTRAYGWPRRRRYRSYGRYCRPGRSRCEFRRRMNSSRRRARGCATWSGASRDGRRRSSGRSHSGRRRWRSSRCRGRWALTRCRSSGLRGSSSRSRGLRLRRSGLCLLRFSRSFLRSQSQEVLTHQFRVRIIDGARMRLLFRHANFG